MKRLLFILVAFTFAWSLPIFAAVQVVNTPSANLDADGVADGVAFTGQGVTPSTLIVPILENINNNNNAIGVSSDLSGASTISFQNNSGTSIINGTVGAINTLLDINGGLGTSTQTFNGIVSTATFEVDTGTMQFNSNANGAVTFTADGSVIIGGGTTFVGAINNLTANQGTLTLNNASTLNGGVGGAVGPLKQVNVVGGNATINGTLSATNFSLGTNTLFLVGAPTLPVNTIINTTVVSDVLFGNINASGQLDNITAPVVTVNADALGATLTGAPLFVVRAGSGTSNVPILVTSNNPAISFIGLNINGNIEILPSPNGTTVPIPVVTNPIAGAVQSLFLGLFDTAAANPGSDLALVEFNLFSLTGAALQDALLQLAPSSGLIGVSRESFNTTKQFQKIWLENLDRNRRYCRFLNCCDDCCNPCCNECEGPRIWADGFGLYSHQDDKGDFNGYKANTWGGVVGFDVPLICDLRVGLGLGYAFTDIDESVFGFNTDINNYQGTLYFTYDPFPWFLDGGFSFGWNRYDGSRHIAFADIDRTANARYNGQEYTGFMTTGYQFYCNHFEISPFASLIYSHLHLDDYSETGADTLDLNIDNQDYDYLESGLGLKVAYLFQTRCGVYIPEVHTMWLYDFEDNALGVNASFSGLAAAAGTFGNSGPRWDRNAWNIGASITCISNADFSVQVIYDYEKRSSYFNHQGMVELSYGF